MVSVGEMLSAAVERGQLVWGSDVSGETWPHVARTYLGDGTGLAWGVPDGLQRHARFTIDAEIVAPVRPVLVRRYGINDPIRFANAWTRAEALAKLDDTPIITWLQRHGLDLPDTCTEAVREGRLAWRTEHRTVDERQVIITFAAALPSRP